MDSDRVKYVFSTYSVRIQYVFTTYSVRIHYVFISKGEGGYSGGKGRERRGIGCE